MAAAIVLRPTPPLPPTRTRRLSYRLTSARDHSVGRRRSLLPGDLHREQRLAVDLQAVDAVLGLDVDHLAARLAEHALHRGGDHPVAVRVAEDDHAASDVRVADQVARVDTTDPDRSTFGTVIADLARGYADHRGPPLLHTLRR